MANVHGVAGEWTRVKGTVWGLWPLLLSIFAAGFSLAVFLFFRAWGAALFAVSLALVAYGFVRGLRHVERYFRGARGEERVSEILQGLPDSYHVYNDFVVGRRHIDHVVVGPAGVFAVETKFWRGRITVEDGHILLDGQLPDRPPLQQAQREAALVKQALQHRGWQGTVTPVLVFASDTFEARIAEVQGVVVLNSDYLRTSFGSGRAVIPPGELERLFRMMDLNA